MGEAEPEEAEADDDGGLIPSAVTMIRLLVAWAFIALGLLDLVMGLDDPRFVIFHVVLLGSGLVLLTLGLLEKRPSRYAYLAGLVIGVAGLAIGGANGFPFPMSHPGHAVADVLFWGCAGLFAVLLATVLTPAHRAAPRHPAGRHTHAEARAEIADDENVGGLP
ncbi:hypothetical protein ACQP2F_42415 [Actinoplanes sp. CA-030573]|uniref:hypothetical protein n=1 Tax=Actinoplanes sp. CA-030573 TaxID=3239898 RepID=UPI003D8F4078